MIISQNAPENVIFFYPSNIVGGAELLFARLAVGLSKHFMNVHVVDIHDGVIANSVKNSLVRHIPYSLNEPVMIPPNSVFIIPPLTLTGIDNLVFQENTRLLMMSMDKLSFLSRFPRLRAKLPFDFNDLKQQMITLNPFLYEKYCHTLELYQNHQALIYTESTNWQINRDIFNLPAIDPNQTQTIPVCPTICNETKLPSLFNLEDSLISSDHINICALGRLSHEKIYCVKYVLENLIRYVENTERSATLHIIGDGPDKNIIEAIPLPPQVTLKFVGTIMNEELDYYMKTSVDCVFAMGTSLLEAAKLKIPAIIVDSKISEIDLDTKLAYLFDSFDYLLGEYSGITRVERRHSFENIMNQLYLENQKCHLADKTYHYYLKNHTPSVAVDILIKQIKSTTLDMELFQNHSLFNINAM